MCRTRHLATPLDEETVRSLSVADTVYLDGIIFGLRDATLRRMFDDGADVPTDLKGYPCIHTAPNATKTDRGWIPLSIGTTTSARMERFSRPLIERCGVPAIIGKGGMGKESTKAMAEHGAVYLAITGGAAALETTQIEAIEDVWWEDLFPECLWKFRVTDLGPLTVGIDATGRNLHREVNERAGERLRELLRRQ